MSAFAEDRDLSVQFRHLRLLETLRSPVQRIQLFEHPSLGKVLVINDEVQHVESWQALYHEPLVHLACAFVPDVHNALVLGGGSLFAAAEILRYPTIECCTLVDHDQSVLEMVARHYKHASRTIADKRFKFVNRKAVEFLEAENGKYDLVVNDCFDTLAATQQSGRSVFKLLHRRLSEDGVCSDPVYRHVFEARYAQETRKALRDTNHALSLITVPEYQGCFTSSFFLEPPGSPRDKSFQSIVGKKPG